MPIPSALTKASFDTRWTSLRRPTEQQVPRYWRSWLTDRGSLTQRLVRLSQGDFRVEVVWQGWSRPTRSEAKALNMRTRQRALIREVQLIGRDQAWVYARSVFPATTLTGSQRQLKLIGTRSLGTILFRDPTMRRGPLQVSRLQLKDRQAVWARRSLFYLSDKPLLVCEVFLPALQQVECAAENNR
ncbi:chorismate--pyruvate lyase family protein [Marinobacterium jannaschii]|uniref:chorismate--pyruvate lyase family protein n=1 Tax=Marinobacterium jannaschii TaxID=64970 RepID=UPI0004887FA8|nr:chorismate lyase [Marinobacterium jannaschii]